MDVTNDTRWIALLRAINVGGHTVKMEHLRSLFVELGFGNVATFIASGNVIFDAPTRDAPTLERRIEQHLHDSLGYAVTTFIRTPAELAAVAQQQPFAPAELADQTNALYVAFLPAAPTSEAQARLLTHRSAADDFHMDGREIYWLCRTKMSESAFSGARLEKAIGLPATMRNITTVRKLAAKYGGKALENTD